MQELARRPKTAQALASRARIVVACAEGLSNSEVSRQVGVSLPTVGKWRKRFVADRMDGLRDEPCPGAPRKVNDAQIEAVITKTLEEAVSSGQPLVDPVDGQGGRAESDYGLTDLAGVRAQAAPGRQWETVDQARCSWTRSTTSSGCV